MRGSTLFSDLGPAGDVYGFESWAVSGSESQVGTSYTTAALFTASGTGALPVTGIDLAVTEAIVSGGQPAQSYTFYASLWTDSAGLPGAEVPGAYWSLSTTLPDASCCALVFVTNIMGVTLTGGQQYFMVLGPLSITDNSATEWAWNSQGATGVVLGSEDGGSTWTLGGSGNTLGAFDVLSTPEPATWPVLLALAGAGLWWWRLRQRSAA